MGAAVVTAVGVVVVTAGVVPKVNLEAALPSPVLCDERDPKVFFAAAPPNTDPPDEPDAFFSSDFA